MIKNILKNPYIIIFGVLSVIGVFVGYSAWIYHEGKEKGISVCDSQKEEAINENIDIKEKQDLVIRPNDKSYIDSLRSNTF